MRHEIILTTVLATAIIIALAIIFLASVRGCQITREADLKTAVIENEAKTKQNETSNNAMLKREELEHASGVKVMLPIYIKGTNAANLDIQR